MTGLGDISTYRHGDIVSKPLEIELKWSFLTILDHFSRISWILAIYVPLFRGQNLGSMVRP